MISITLMESFYLRDLENTFPTEIIESFLNLLLNILNGFFLAYFQSLTFITQSS